MTKCLNKIIIHSSNQQGTNLIKSCRHKVQLKPVSTIIKNG